MSSRASRSGGAALWGRCGGRVRTTCRSGAVLRGISSSFMAEGHLPRWPRFDQCRWWLKLTSLPPTVVGAALAPQGCIATVVGVTCALGSKALTVRPESGDAARCDRRWCRMLVSLQVLQALIARRVCERQPTVECTTSASTGISFSAFAELRVFMLEAVGRRSCCRPPLMSWQKLPRLAK